MNPLVDISKRIGAVLLAEGADPTKKREAEAGVRAGNIKNRKKISTLFLSKPNPTSEITLNLAFLN